jgi:DHA2 family multidrug resistance protein
MTAEWGFAELFWPQVLRGLSVMLCIVPSVGLALSLFQGPELRSASGLFNLMRNLGGAIGIAVVNTWLQDDARIEATRLGENLAHATQAATDAVTSIAARLAVSSSDPVHAQMMAQKLFGGVVGRQALSLAFDDVFRTMALLFVAALVMVPFARLPKTSAPSHADTH